MLPCEKFAGTYAEFFSGVQEAVRSEDAEERLLARHDPEIAYTALSLLSSFDRGLVHPGLTMSDIIGIMRMAEATPSRRAVLWSLAKSGSFCGDVGVLRAMFPGSAPGVREILSQSADMSGSSLEQIRSRSRDLDVSYCRMRAEWIARNAFDASVAQISEIMGRNHTTVLASMSRVDIMIRRSPGIIIPIFEQANAIDRLSQLRRARAVLSQPISGRSP